MNFNAEYSSFIKCYIYFKNNMGYGQTLVKLKAVPRPGDFICVGQPDGTARDYEVNRVVHCTQHTAGEVEVGRIQIHCTELTHRERAEKLS